jgi:hypothetical protein
MIKPLGCELATCPLCKSLAAEVAYRAALVAEVARLRKGIEHALDQYAGGYPHGDTLRSLLVPHDVP